MAIRILSTSSRYCSLVYRRFMACRILVEPDCRGRWRCRHILEEAAITSISSSDRSLGWDVIKRITLKSVYFPTSGSSPAKLMGSSRLPKEFTLLAEQHDFHHAVCHQVFDFLNDILRAMALPLLLHRVQYNSCRNCCSQT